MSLIYVAQQLIIYGGFSLLITGVIGDSINIFIFSTTRNYRQTSSSFHFLVGSIVDLTYLLCSLTTRILATGFNIDLFDKNLAFCRIRSYYVTVLTLISFTCYCLASINQFLSTSRQPKLRQFSDIKWARRILFIMIPVWCVYDIPDLLYNNISSISDTCVITNPDYSNYTMIALFIFLFGLPVLVLVVFGYLSYRNIHQIRALAQQNADRQLTKMTIMQAALICFSIIPYGMIYAYSVITLETPKDINRQMEEYLAFSITELISYVHFSGSFYVFLLSSKRFRRTVKKRLLFCKSTNEIHPIDARQT